MEKEARIVVDESILLLLKIGILLDIAQQIVARIGDMSVVDEIAIVEENGAFICQRNGIEGVFIGERLDSRRMEFVAFVFWKIVG